jgi:hypothetical protein
MNRHAGFAGRIDEPAVMLARVQFEEVQREAERQRLIDEIGSARPRRRSLLSHLAHRWRIRWAPGSRRVQHRHEEVRA